MRKIRTAGLRGASVFAAFLLAAPMPGWSAPETKELETGETAFYKDVFDQNLYSEGVNQLDLGRWVRKIFRKEIPSANVNLFDEVPDSPFFTNRHGRFPLSPDELEKGYRETNGLDLRRPLMVTSSERQGIHPRLIIKDAQGNRYLLKFDTMGNLELNTAAEVIASRFYYALGYNVFQDTIVHFKREQLKVEPGSFTYDDSGFRKGMTENLLNEYLSLVPAAADGSFRAAAVKISPDHELGNTSFWSRNKKDREDPVNHRDRREIRGLQVFSAWLNNYDMREGNAVAILATGNGKPFAQHYLVDFTNALGASTDGPKPPMFGYEYMVDYGEAFKSFLGLGFREKPWQKKWRLAGEKTNDSAAVGYFTNELFDPAKYKTQLPYEAFRLVSRADGFWAAKIMMKFSDEDIRAAVRAGQYTRPEDADYIAKTLIERRDLILKYWFAQANPLDGFEFSDGRLFFKDLAVEHGCEPASGTTYHAEVFPSADKGHRLATLEVSEPSMAMKPEWFAGDKKMKVIIRTSRAASKKLSLPVTILLNTAGVQGIQHED